MRKIELGIDVEEGERVQEIGIGIEDRDGIGIEIKGRNTYGNRGREWGGDGDQG
jgi:hypothetical protein